MQLPVRTGLSQELMSDIVEWAWFTNSPCFTMQANKPSLCVNTLGPGLLFPAYLDSKFRAMVQTIRPFLLRGPAEDEELLSWLPLARASFTISVADKIIMIHRPVLFWFFYIPEFQRTRTTCISAALTILQQHKKITEREGTIFLWTHSAVCVTAAVVIGLDLLYRVNHTDEQARRLLLELI